MKTWKQIQDEPSEENSDTHITTYKQSRVKVSEKSMIDDSVQIGRDVTLDNATINAGAIINRRAKITNAFIYEDVEIPKGMIVHNISVTHSPLMYEGHSFAVYFVQDLMYWNGQWNSVERFKAKKFLKPQEGLRLFIHEMAEGISQRVKAGRRTRLQPRYIPIQTTGMDI